MSPTKNLLLNWYFSLIKKIQRDLYDFWHWKLTMKVWFRHFLTTHVNICESQIKKHLYFTDFFAKMTVYSRPQNFTTEVSHILHRKVDIQFSDISTTSGGIDFIVEGLLTRNSFLQKWYSLGKWSKLSIALLSDFKENRQVISIKRIRILNVSFTPGL
jgi:hypothetical protein